RARARPEGAPARVVRSRRRARRPHARPPRARGALVSTDVRKQGWIRRLVGYMKPHKKNAYIAFGVAIGGQLIQSLLPIVQKVVVDDVITPHTRNGVRTPGKPLAPWLILMIAMGVFTF